MEEKKIINENELQDLCGKFVEREVFCCLTSEIEYILKKSWEDPDALYSYENGDIENLYCYRIEGIDLTGLSMEVITDNELKDNIKMLEGQDEYSDEEKDTLIHEIDNYIDALDSEDCLNDDLEIDEKISKETHDRNEKQIDEIKDRLTDYKTDEVENAESEMQEIYEWWAVSSWLANKLIEAGHPVIKGSYSPNLWGRCTTGQAILLDGIVRTLVKERHNVEGNGKYE